MERSLQGVDRLGSSCIKRDQAENMALQAVADARRMVENLETVAAKHRVRERLRVYHNLMNQAREDLAYKQAGMPSVTTWSVQGKTVPPAVIAAYRSGLVGYHARELMEMQRDREERFLAVLLQVDKLASALLRRAGHRVPQHRRRFDR